MADPRNPLEQDVELVDAFRHVFHDADKNAQVSTVLEELASFSGYYDVPPANATALDYARDAGRREVFARILYLARVDNAYRETLRAAALRIREALNEGQS